MQTAQVIGRGQVPVIMRPVEVALGLCPCLQSNKTPCRSRVQVVLFEVDPAIAARDASLGSRVTECRPMQGDVRGWDGSRFGPRTSGIERNRAAEAVASSKEPENLCASCAEGAVTGAVTREGRSGEVGRLIG